MFYVYVQGTREPRKPHESFESAKAEADRLALKERRLVSIYYLVDAVEPPMPKEADSGLV